MSFVPTFNHKRFYKVKEEDDISSSDDDDMSFELQHPQPVSLLSSLVESTKMKYLLDERLINSLDDLKNMTDTISCEVFYPLHNVQRIPERVYYVSEEEDFTSSDEQTPRLDEVYYSEGINWNWNTEYESSW